MQISEQQLVMKTGKFAPDKRGLHLLLSFEFYDLQLAIHYNVIDAASIDKFA